MRKVPTKTAFEAVQVAAQRHAFHPVRDYLGGLKWDGTPRLDAWLTTYLGAEASDYGRFVGRSFLVAAVARVMHPGCKMDTVLVLEGEQGSMKSTAVAALAGEWFTDTPIFIGSKDAMQALHGKWIVELAEMDAVIRAEPSGSKAFFTSSTDDFRPPYGRRTEHHPRQCVFMGTVNLDAYLKDSTGNRRYWPVRCGAIDMDGLKRDRDQLWAEAVERYRSGERWWAETDKEVAFCRAEQELRFLVDALELDVRTYLEPKATAGRPVTQAELLREVFRLEPGRWGVAEQTRLGRILARLGWSKHRPREGSGMARYHEYWPPAPAGHGESEHVGGEERVS